MPGRRTRRSRPPGSSRTSPMSSRTRGLLLAGIVAALAALPALGQDNAAPKSLLPPGFGNTHDLPPPAPKAEPQVRPQQPSQQGPAQASPQTPGAPAAEANAAEGELN